MTEQNIEVVFECTGTATGKMRNDLDVRMVSPLQEHFTLATDEGAFHGGDASAPPPLALFIGGLTGCIMTQLRAFAKRLKVHVNDVQVETRIVWEWMPKDRIYETAPKSFHMDIIIDSPNSLESVIHLVKSAKKGCFIEQTLRQENTITHRIKTADGFVNV